MDRFELYEAISEIASLMWTLDADADLLGEESQNVRELQGTTREVVDTVRRHFGMHDPDDEDADWRMPILGAKVALMALQYMDVIFREVGANEPV